MSLRLPSRWLVLALLAVLTVAVFAEVRRYPLVDFDDLAYVTDNPHVTDGLSPANVAWAFTHAHEGYWAPLTWISYMADASRSGLDGGAFHVTNLALHVAAVWLLFLGFTRMTGQLWPSAAVASLFAVHPLHVESVAWVAERKDVLSGFFWFAAIWAYARYVERPGPARYTAIVVVFVCGLLSKPIVVTLPLALLLLDVWPLGRLGGTGRPPIGTIVREKIPLVVLALAAAIVTVIVQGRAGAVSSLTTIPLSTRVANAAVSAGAYLWQTIWPAGLAALYPYPAAPPIGPAAMACVVLLAVSILAIALRRRAPYLLVGWLWYLVTLLPVLGLIQAGPQARADRYTYLSLVGIFIMAVWALAELGRRSVAMRWAVTTAACLAIGVSAAAARRQVSYWQDSQTVFRRAIAVTTGNYVAQVYLGGVLRSAGDTMGSLRAFEEAIRVAPRFPEAYAGYGETLMTVNPYRAAAALAEAVRLRPEDVASRVRLGVAQARTGRLDDAARELEEALRLEPASGDAHYALGMVLARQKRYADAVGHFAEAARLNPELADVHIQLGNTLAVQGRMKEAIVALTRAAELKPEDAELHSNLAVALASDGRLDDAIAQITEAVRLSPDRQDLRNNLAYLEGRRRGSGRQ